MAGHGRAGAKAAVSDPEPFASTTAREQAFRAADRAFVYAAGRGAAGERRLRLAGFNVRLRFAGPELAAILDPAFGHLAAPKQAGAEDLVVTLIDGPFAARAPDAQDAGLDSARSAPGLWLDLGDSTRTLTDFARGRCLQWIPEVAKLPAWAAASPLRACLGQFLASRGRFLLHGAAIGTASGAVLLAAKGGSGKSTSALACLEVALPGMRRLQIAGDDFVVLEPDAREPRVHSFLGTAKIGRAQTALFPSLERLVVRGGPLDSANEKAVLQLFPGAADRLAPVLPLRAIAVPVLALESRESRIEEATRAEVLLALAPSSILLVPGVGQQTLEAISALVSQLPLYRLRIGSDLKGIPAALAGLLASLTAGSEARAPALARLAEPLLA